MLSVINKRNATIFSVLILIATAAFAVMNVMKSAEVADAPKASYIVQGKAIDAMSELVEQAGGEISHRLPIINAIGALLTDAQFELLSQQADLRVSENRKVVSHSSRDVLPDYAIETYITRQTRANFLHRYGIKGQGVTIATIDSGISDKFERGAYIRLDSTGNDRVLAKYDALKGKESKKLDDDSHGHGSHIAGVAISSAMDEKGRFNGIAPDSDLVSIKAFDGSGQGSYLDVLDGINWMIENKDRFNIRVANMSFGSEVYSFYWDDPLNQAVMAAWDAGIVVVTSAGNQGPVPMTITAPGNIPYVITVGAVTDDYTPYSFKDDRITTFSSQGPTIDAFIKPEVVSWGGHVRGKINGRLVQSIEQKYHKASEGGEDYYMISGTSQASAVVTGTVALMLSLEPNLSPDTIKCRLMHSARPLRDADTGKKISPFKQGAGRTDAWSAVMSYADNCANKGLDIKADLAGEAHYVGTALINNEGEFAALDQNGNVQSEGLGWGASLKGLGWGANLNGLGWGASLEGFGWGASVEGLGWGVSMEGLGWGASVEGLGWGSSLEGLGWGSSLEGLGWGNSLEGLGWGNSLEGLGWGNSKSSNLESATVEIEPETEFADDLEVSDDFDMEPLDNGKIFGAEQPDLELNSATE
jgi:serine protease AprX